MKTLSCDLCDHTAQGNTFKEWIMELMPHYMQAHADIMGDTSKGEKEMQERMNVNKERFDAVTEE